MNRGVNGNTVLGGLFVIIGLAGLVRSEWFEAIAGIALGICVVLYAPPRTRNKTVASYIFGLIATVSLVVWLVVLTGFLPLR